MSDLNKKSDKIKPELSINHIIILLNKYNKKDKK